MSVFCDIEMMFLTVLIRMIGTVGDTVAELIERQTDLFTQAGFGAFRTSSIRDAVFTVDQTMTAAAVTRHSSGKRQTDVTAASVSVRTQICALKHEGKALITQSSMHS